MKIDKFDIVALKDKVVQYLGKEMDNGAIVQDIHCRKELIHVALIQRKATKDETKWFCERTENSQFAPPVPGGAGAGTAAAGSPLRSGRSC